MDNSLHLWNLHGHWTWTTLSWPLWENLDMAPAYGYQDTQFCSKSNWPLKWKRRNPTILQQNLICFLRNREQKQRLDEESLWDRETEITWRATSILIPQASGCSRVQIACCVSGVLNKTKHTIWVKSTLIKGLMYLFSFFLQPFDWYINCWCKQWY